MTSNPTDLIPYSKCASETGISCARLYELAKLGQGPRVTRVGQRKYVRRRDLTKWIKSRAERNPHRIRVESGILRRLISLAEIPEAEKDLILEILMKHGVVLPSVAIAAEDK